MSLRSVARKLRGLLPGAPPRPDARDLLELADFHHPATRDIVRKMELETRLIYEESRKRIRRNCRYAGLAAVTSAGFVVTAVLSIREAFKELNELEFDKMKVEPKGKSSVHST